jgi:hypothetical protein
LQAAQGAAATKDREKQEMIDNAKEAAEKQKQQ